MGWVNVCNLRVVDKETEQSSQSTATLYHRQGIEGVEVHHEGEVIILPREVLLRLYAEHWKSEIGRRFEMLTIEEILERLIREHV